MNGRLKLAVVRFRSRSRSKGISRSSLPYKRSPPSWLRVSAQEVVDMICKNAKKGMTPSQIGLVLRDSSGIGQIRAVTGNKIVRILKANGAHFSPTPLL